MLPSLNKNLSTKLNTLLPSATADIYVYTFLHAHANCQNQGTLLLLLQRFGIRGHDSDVDMPHHFAVSQCMRGFRTTTQTWLNCPITLQPCIACIV